MIRCFDHHDFDARDLLGRKGGQRISVCLPAHNEEATVGQVVRAVRHQLVEQVPLVDEVLVIDDHSADGTAEMAERAGAAVIPAASVLAAHPNGRGKGRALWKSVHAAEGDLIVWCDTDITNFNAHFVVGLLGPLLCEDDVGYVKGFYRRPLGSAGEGGGRVTELVARPLINLLYPELAGFVQPLSGEYAGRRELLEQVPFVAGYGVEVGLLIDLSRRFGVGPMVQCDLGTRRHRNRSLEELGPQAMTIMQVALRRSDPTMVPESAVLERPDAPPVTVDASELPPLVTVAEYRRRHGDRRPPVTGTSMPR